MSPLFGRRASSPEQEFWAWFARNEADLFEFEKDRQAAFDRVGAALRKVHPRLTFEFGPLEGGRRCFVISADGIREAFPSVQALHAAAPELPRWRFVKFRPRRRTILNVAHGGHALDPEGIRFDLEPDRGKAGITAYVPDLRRENTGSFIAPLFLILDQALGEFDVEANVGFIHLLPAEAAPAGAVGIGELPEAFDQLITALRS